MVRTREDFKMEAVLFFIDGSKKDATYPVESATKMNTVL